MKLWPLIHKKPKEPTKIFVKGYGDDTYAAIPIRLITPIEINHTVIHSPYPRPTMIIIHAVSKEGRRWQMPAIQCRGGGYYQLSMPHQFEGDEYVSLEINVRYD